MCHPSPFPFPDTQLYEEMLEGSLELEEGGWQELAGAASRGDTAAGLLLLKSQCESTGADLSAWGQLLDVYGVFNAGLGALDTTLL